MAIKIQIVAEDKATPVINRALDAPRKKASETALGIKKGFADAFENVTQNATGAFGSVAGGLFKIPGPAGQAIAIVLALGGAFFTLAKKSAEANAATDAGAAAFLVSLKKISDRVSDNLDLIGNFVTPAFNNFAKVLGVAATQQEILALQTRKQNDAMIAGVKSTDAFVAKLNEFLDASERLLRTQILKDYFAAFAAGNKALADAYSKQLAQLDILQVRVKAVGTEQKKNDDDAKKRFDENVKRFQDNLKFEAAARQLQITATAEQRKIIDKFFEESDARYRSRQEAGLEDLRENARKELGIHQKGKEDRVKLLEDVANKQREIGAQILQGIAGSLAAAVIQGESLKKVLDNILKQLATQLLTKLILGGLTGIFAGPTGKGLGAIGKLFGFQHGGSFTVGGSGGIDQSLVAFRATRGERVTVTPPNPANVNNVTNNHSSPVNVSINVTAGSFDRNFVLSELVPMLNREVKNGLDLYASKIK